MSNEDKIKAMNWIEDRIYTISIRFEDSSKEWIVEDIIDNVFTGPTLTEACLKAIEYYGKIQDNSYKGN